MEESNQLPKTEGCSAEGEPVDLWYYRDERPSRSVPRDKHEPQAGPASRLSNSASKAADASGDGVSVPEPNTETPVYGEGVAGLPGSKSVARAEADARNRGGPESPCRTNYESQAGRAAQRQEAPSGAPGVGSAHSIQPQGASPEAGEGADRSTQSAQATSTVRTTETDWQTFLRAIAEKADQDKHHRFGDLYRWLNQDVLRLSFYRLRKDAASGVDGVSFQEYEKNLEVNLADLEGRLRRKAYRARLVRRKYIPKGNGKLRPLGILVLEDKLLQMAATQILLAIYEGEFLPCSYGYRPGVRAHDAIQDLTQELQFGGHHFVVEADIKGFFDHVQWEWLERMLERRIADGAFMNLIRKWLRAGVLEEDGKVVHPQSGTPQGGIMTPRTQWITCKFSAPARSPGRNRMVDRDQVFADCDLLDEQAQQLLSFNRSHCLSGPVQAAKKSFHRVAHFDPTLVFHSSHLQVLLLLLQRPEFLSDLRGSLS